MLPFPACQSTPRPSPSLPPARIAHPALLAPFSQEVPGAAFKFDMVPVPGDAHVKPFYMAKTELTWEAFDPFVFKLDEEESSAAAPASPDAITRPSKPYLPPDRGLGHEGYAAISMSCENAKAYCHWLSAKSGKKYRLPTVAEWQHACDAPVVTGGPGAAPGAPSTLAWLAGNSGGVPHPVATTAPNALGLYDMRGNVMEWCIDDQGSGVACGGCYKDAAATCTTFQSNNPDWNRSDPQIPKSKWWLADGPFVGFRVVSEP